MEEESDKWWEDNEMTNEKLEKMFLNNHYRTERK